MTFQIFLLVLEVAGIALAGAALVALGNGRGERPRAALAAATAAATVVLLAYGLPSSARTAVSAVNTIHRDLNVTQTEARKSCASEPGLPNLEFIDFLAHQIGQRERYVLYMSPELQRQSAALCVAFILLPRVQVPTEKEANWAVFFGATPARWRKRLASSSPDVYRVAPGLALVRLHRNAR